MSLREHILNNFWLKVFSLFLAALIWYVIDSSSDQSKARFPDNPFRVTPSRDFRRPIAVHTSPSSQQFFRIEPAEVDVTVEGDGATLEKLTARDVEVYLRLTDVPEAQGSFPVEVRLPPRVSLKQVSPHQVQVEPVNPN